MLRIVLIGLILAILLLGLPLVVQSNTRENVVEKSEIEEFIEEELVVEEMSTKDKAFQFLELSKEFDVSLSVIDQIKLQAAIHEVDESLALNIACSESRFLVTAKNPTSTASGVFQWLRGSFAYYGVKYWGSIEDRDVFNASDNIELAMLVLRDRGTTDWNASKHVWTLKPFENGRCS